MKIPKKVIESYFKPWPIILPKGYYSIGFKKLTGIKNLKAYWPNEKGKRISSFHATKKIIKEDWLGKRHQIQSIVKHSKLEIPYIIVTRKNVIVDGNHRLCSLIIKKYKGFIMIIKHI